MAVNLRLSQEQFVTLTDALEYAISHAKDDAGEALKKHNLGRYRRRKDDARAYERIRQLIEMQYSHPEVVDD